MTETRQIHHVVFCRHERAGQRDLDLWVTFVGLPPRTENCFGASNVKRDALVMLMDALGVDQHDGFAGRTVNVRRNGDGRIVGIAPSASAQWLMVDEMRER